MKKLKTQQEIDAEIARFRMQSAAMKSLSKEEQIDVIQSAMEEGSLPVKVDIQFN